MYKLSGVTKNYQKGRQAVAALRGVDLVVEDRDWLSIQGPTGHGKSTLLQILGGLDRPTAGVVELDGQDLAQMREVHLTQVRASSIGFVFQTFNLIPTLSAQENVETALVPLGIRGDDRRARTMKALADVGLADRARHLPSELSGGQQQRVALARALVKEPKVLLADEPTGNLDENTRDEIMVMLEKVWQEYGLTMIVVTHDSFVAKRAQRIGVMRNGRLTTKSTARRLRNPAQTPGPRTDSAKAAVGPSTQTAQSAAAPKTEAAKAAAIRAAEAKAALAAAEAAAAEARAAAEAAEAEAIDADSAELTEDSDHTVNTNPS
jgi:putative ABC transport system ATP-binding protein